MKLFVNFSSMRHNESPISAAIKQVAKLFSIEIVDDFEQADMIICESVSDGLNYLKENEEAQIVFSFPPKSTNQAGAESLARNYPDRVKIVPLIDSLVPFLMKTAAEHA